MNWKNLLVSACLTASPLTTLAQAAPLVTLVENGQPRAVIVMAPYTAPVPVADPAKPKAKPAFTPEQRVDMGYRAITGAAVADLVMYFEKMSGARLEIVTAPLAADDKRVPIYIGEAAIEKFGPMTFKGLARQGFRVVVKPEGVGLMGEWERYHSFAIYEVLERLGCRWMMPSEMGEVVPEKKTISLPVGDTSETPGTFGRILWHLDGNYTRRIRNGGQGVSAGHALEVPGGKNPKTGVAANYGYLTRQQLEEHPEWNAMMGGVRRINGRFCWGNTEVSDAIAERIIASAERGSRNFSLSPADGSNFCECELCKKLDTGDYDSVMDTMSITDRFVNFANRIATKVTAKYPDVKFGFLAYVQFTQPPTKEKLHPALAVQLAPINYCRAHAITDNCESRKLMGRIVEGWGKATDKISYYQYMFNLAEYTAPYPMIHQMSVEQPFIYANNVKYWQPEGMTNMDQILPGHYLSNRMAWNPKDDPKRVMDEFFTLFYGAASEPMRRYWMAWDDAFTKVDEHSGANWAYPRRFTPEFLKSVRVMMDEALKAAKTDKEKFRVKMQDENLKQITLMMQLRFDLNEGRLENLATDSMKWRNRQVELGNEYQPQAAFSKIRWTPLTAGGNWFARYMQPPYMDAGRISAFANWVSPPLRNFKWMKDTPRAQEKIGEKSGWHKADFDDSTWKTTDVGTDTFATMGIPDFYGPVYYRANLAVKDVPTDGRRTFLWISATDGNAKVYVNGERVPWLKPDDTPYLGRGDVPIESPTGYGRPFSFNVTKFLKPGAQNQITIVGTHTFINELGTGGLLGPVYLYQEKTPNSAVKVPELKEE